MKQNIIGGTMEQTTGQTTGYTFEIAFPKDYRSVDRVYREGVWYNIPVMTKQPAFTTRQKATEEVKDLVVVFAKASGQKLQWRVKKEEVVESGVAH